MPGSIEYLANSLHAAKSQSHCHKYHSEARGSVDWGQFRKDIVSEHFNPSTIAFSTVFIEATSENRLREQERQVVLFLCTQKNALVASKRGYLELVSHEPNIIQRDASIQLHDSIARVSSSAN